MVTDTQNIFVQNSAPCTIAQAETILLKGLAQGQNSMITNWLAKHPTRYKE